LLIAGCRLLTLIADRRLPIVRGRERQGERERFNRCRGPFGASDAPPQFVRRIVFSGRHGIPMR
jgi:hypothetical protein